MVSASGRRDSVIRRILDLTLQMASREIAARYRGSWAGLGWVVLAPLFLLAIYTFVFAVIFRARWPELASGNGSASEFALIVFSGMVLHGLLADCLVRAPTLVVSNANFVKKSVFPLEVLAGVQLLAALFMLVPTFAILVVFQLFVFGLPPATIVLYPLILLPLSLFALGSMWMVSAVAVYFRDVAQLMGLLVTALFFLSPVLYPTSLVPGALQQLLFVNPLTYAIETSRGMLFWGDLPAIGSYLAYLAGSLAFAVIGFRAFRMLKDGFADAL